jgi:hypothetical protein
MASLPAHPRFSLPHLTLRARPSAKPRVDTAATTPPTDAQNRQQAALRLQAEDRARRETSVAPPRT